MTGPEDRIALVTGSSGGIGRAIALRLARDGVAVAVTARTDARYPGTIEETVDEIRRQGGSAVGLECDLSDAAQRALLVPRVEAELGSIDILVNNAAVSTFSSVADFPERRFTLMHEVQVRAPFELCQAVLPGMIERRRGWIVNVSSSASHHPRVTTPSEFWKQSTVYGMCKAALERFTTGLAAEVHEYGITVNAIYPSHGVTTFGASSFNDLVHVDRMPTESPEVMAEASSRLCALGSPAGSGRIVYDHDVLREAGIPFGGHVTMSMEAEASS